jgi:hypothetical protein
MDLLVALLVLNFTELFTYILFFDSNNPIFKLPLNLAGSSLAILSLSTVLLKTMFNIPTTPYIIEHLMTQVVKDYVYIKYGFDLIDISPRIYNFMERLTHIQANDDSLTIVNKYLTFWAGYTFGISISDACSPQVVFNRHYLTGVIQYLVDNYQTTFGSINASVDAPTVVDVENKAEIKPDISSEVTVSLVLFSVVLISSILLI